jgi:hypothetical protein
VGSIYICLFSGAALPELQHWLIVEKLNPSLDMTDLTLWAHAFLGDMLHIEQEEGTLEVGLASGITLNAWPDKEHLYN